jgi:bifunctional DNA-binding transcriptional regulator/antitoxin component of YhaV-PrlF toxin-antitoxin module
LTRKGQMTMPRAAQEAAGFRPGDVLRIEATGPGRVVVTLEEDPITKYAGSEPDIVPPGMTALEYVRQQREEWPD